MKRLILLAVVLSVGVSLAGWRGRFDEQFAAATASWTPAKLNPIAWYKGDGNALDAMGNYNGTWVGTEAYADGVTGQALSFGGAERMMTATPYTTAIDRSRGFTVCAWLKPRANFIDYGDLAFTRDISTQKICITSRKDGMFFGRFVDASGTTWDTVPYTHPINEWVHVALHLDDTKGTLFINGQAYSSTVSHTTAYTLADCFFALGGYRVSTQVSNHNDIDDVLIFDRALTAEEVELLYTKSMAQNGAEWGQPPPPWTPAVLNPVAWYQGEGNAKDSSGNGYDGTWAGPALYTLAEIDTSTPRTSTEISNDIQRVQGKAILLQGLNAVIADTRSNIAETVVLGDAEVAGLYLQQMKKPVPPLLEQAPTNTVEYIVGAGMRQDLGAE